MSKLSDIPQLIWTSLCQENRHGKTVRIAVIDNGLIPEYTSKSLNICNYYTYTLKTVDNSDEGLLFVKEEDITVFTTDLLLNGSETGTSDQILGYDFALGRSRSGAHGTCVVHTILKYSKNTPVEFVIYDVFDEYGSSSGTVLIEVIKDILMKNIDIAVMSLTCSREYEKEFLKLRESVLEKGIIILCSASNDGKDLCPSYLDYIYGVNGDDTLAFGEYTFDIDRKYQFSCNTLSEIINCGNEKIPFSGTSKATAVIGGILACYLYNRLEYGQEILPRDKSCISGYIKTDPR